jgi:Family of unknown function (DUF5681)
MKGMFMSSDDESVGYKRPPRSRQFRPGQSGNPTGKNKGARNIATELQDILSEQVTFAENGTLKTMSKQRALASALVSAAIDGDLRATAIVMSHLSRDVAKHGNDEESDAFEAVQAHRKQTKRRP